MRILLLLLVGGLCAQTSDLYLAPTDGVPIDISNTAVPTSPTELCSAKDCWVGFLTVVNTTGGAITLMVKDGQNTPFQLLPSASIQANSSQGGSWLPAGLYMQGGLRVQAGSAGLQLYLHAKRVK